MTSRVRMVALALLACVTACAGTPAEDALPFYRSAALDPEFLGARDAEHVAAREIRFVARDQHDRSLTDTTLRGRVTLVHFFFASCGQVCPMASRNIAQLLDSVGASPRAQVLSFSVTPEQDSVPALRAFAQHSQIADARWHLLTGSRAQLEVMARDGFFVSLGDGRPFDVARVAHTETVFLLDARGRLRGVYASSLRLEMARAAADIRALIAESEHSDTGA